MSARGVQFGSCSEAIQRFMVVRNVSQSRLSTDMGFGSTRIATLKNNGRISIESEARIFAYLDANWPSQVAKPAVIRDFMRYSSAGSLESWRKIYDPQPVLCEATTGGTKRPCITCQTIFPSEGAHNRMCSSCRPTSQPFGAHGIYQGGKKSVTKHA